MGFCKTGPAQRRSRLILSVISGVIIIGVISVGIVALILLIILLVVLLIIRRSLASGILICVLEHKAAFLTIIHVVGQLCTAVGTIFHVVYLSIQSVWVLSLKIFMKWVPEG